MTDWGIKDIEAEMARRHLEFLSTFLKQQALMFGQACNWFHNEGLHKYALIMGQHAKEAEEAAERIKPTPTTPKWIKEVQEQEGIVT